MPSRLHPTLTLLYFSVPLLVAADSPFSPFPPESSHKCYFIDGSFDPAGGPCYGNVGASMCCYTGERCLPGSGLCLASPNGNVAPHDNGSSIWRRSCTDTTWQDPACLAIAYDCSTRSLQLSSCDDGTVCPRTKEDINSTCCDDYQGQFPELGHAPIPKSVVGSIQATETSTASSAPHTDSSTSSIASATASQTTASTSASTSTSMSSASVSIPISTSRSASATGLGQSAKIGIGVGVSFGTLLIALSSFVAFRLYRKRPEEATLQIQGLEQKDDDTRSRQRYELTGVGPPKEMYTVHSTHEVEPRAGPSELWDTRLDE